jgi:BirA family biotin operon repressor/biotin-[acetyl-CoA-carboxylase] ligase
MSLPAFIPNQYSESPQFDHDRLRAALGGAAVRFELAAVAECDSTNAVLGSLASTAPSGTVLLADRQTAGRGRRGRQWQSSLAEPAASLTFSVLRRFDVGLDRLAGLSLAVGVAIARGLGNLGVPLAQPGQPQGLGLKWPNDILVAGPCGLAKLGGVLVELQGGREGVAAVIGIGLNLQAPPAVASMPGALPVAALAELPPFAGQTVLMREDVLGAVLRQLVNVLDAFAAQGFAACLEEWQGYHLWQGKPVQLLEQGEVLASGVCRGADADGALLLESAGQVTRHWAGDVSLRELT